MEGASSKKAKTRVANSYFTCTLDHVAKWNKRHPTSFHTIWDLLDHRAGTTPDAPAVGFPVPSRDEDGRDQVWAHEVYS